MNDLLLLILSSIIILFLIMLFFIFIRRRLVLSQQGDELVLKYPVKKRKVNLSRQLDSWEVEKTYYLRWGIFYSIKMRMKDGSYLSVDSLFNQQKFDRLYQYLNSSHHAKRKAET